jgi:polyisoprenoid-binding protein YceI
VNAQEEELPVPGVYRIIPEQSKIQIKAGTAGVFGFMGHGHTIVPKTFSGQLTMSPQNTPLPALTLRIDAKSLQETADFKAEDKIKIEKQLHEEVLETTRYPEILFQSTGVRYTMRPGHVFETQIEGDLTLHGVTRKITIPATVLDTGPSLRASGRVKLERKDYNIETKSAGGGTVKVDKTLEVDFDIVLQPQ